MSMRIHKALGYAFTDLETSVDGEIIDKRINPDSILLNEEAFDDRFTSTKEALLDYQNFLTSSRAVRPDMDITILRNIQNHGEYFSFPSTVTHEPEFAFPEVLMVTPVSCYKEWLRKDDAIDYVEASLLPDPSTPLKNIHWSGFYPFSTGYINRETGEEYNSYDALDFIRALNSVQDKSFLTDWRSLPTDRYDALMYASGKLGIDNYLTAMEVVVPEVPNDVINLATWSELVPNDRYFRDMRPVSYTYWS